MADKVSKGHLLRVPRDKVSIKSGSKSDLLGQVTSLRWTRSASLLRGHARRLDSEAHGGRPLPVTRGWPASASKSEIVGVNLKKNRLCLLYGSAGKATAAKLETAKDFDIRYVDYC